MCCKTCLEMNKAIMSKAYEEGSDLVFWELLVSAFLMLGIVDLADEKEIELTL